MDIMYYLSVTMTAIFLDMQYLLRIDQGLFFDVKGMEMGRKG